MMQFNFTTKELFDEEGKLIVIMMGVVAATDKEWGTN